jgi:Uma2 family endonuclease
MPIVSTIKMKARQFIALGEDPAGVRLELVDGEVAVSPSPSPDHSYADSMLRHLLISHVSQHDLGQLFGDVDTVFGEYDVRRPDLIYFQKSRLHLVGDNAMEGPPDLCVEIISPSSAVIDREDKFEQYAKGGVAYYWIVDPQKKTLEGYQLTDGRFVLQGQGRDDTTVQLPPFHTLQIPLKLLWRPRA